MVTKHTPGPWRFLDDEVIENTKGYIITSLKCDVRFSLDTTMANAKLIAAAPDLFEALLELTKWVGKIDDWIGEDPPIEIVEAALKKATE